jgi:hypothetical protein
LLWWLNPLKDYTGGELCFFVNDKVHVLDRPVGSLVQYPPKVPHGITHLSSGTQKSLFVVDRPWLLTWKKWISLLRLVLPHLLFKAQEHQPGSPAMIGQQTMSWFLAATSVSARNVCSMSAVAALYAASQSKESRGHIASIPMLTTHFSLSHCLNQSHLHLSM